MKKILTALALTITLFSCKKPGIPGEIEPPNVIAKYKVSFNIADFAANGTIMSTPGTKTVTAVADTLKKYADNIYYRIYKIDGSWLNAADQPAISASFGTVTDSLPTGTYTIFLAASKGALRTSNKTVPYAQADYGPPLNIWSDTFTKAFTLTVAKSDVSQSVSLERVVSAFQVVLEDAIPADAAKVIVKVQSDYPTLLLDGSNKNATLTTSLIEYPLTAADRGLKNKAFLGFLSNTFNPITLTISAYNSSNILVAEKIIKDVKFEKNKKTTLTGPLMPNNPAEDFKVVVNPIWAPGNSIKF